MQLFLATAPIWPSTPFRIGGPSSRKGTGNCQCFATSQHVQLLHEGPFKTTPECGYFAVSLWTIGASTKKTSRWTFGCSVFEDIQIKHFVTLDFDISIQFRSFLQEPLSCIFYSHCPNHWDLTGSRLCSSDYLSVVFLGQLYHLCLTVWYSAFIINSSRLGEKKRQFSCSKFIIMSLF